MVISSQALILYLTFITKSGIILVEGSETISQESTPKWVEAPSPFNKGDDIVRALWKHKER